MPTVTNISIPYVAIFASTLVATRSVATPGSRTIVTSILGFFALINIATVDSIASVATLAAAGVATKGIGTHGLLVTLVIFWFNALIHISTCLSIASESLPTVASVRAHCIRAICVLTANGVASGTLIDVHASTSIAL